MKKIYKTSFSVMNGTVTMKDVVNCFTSKELAEKTLKAIKKANAKSDVDIWYGDIEEDVLYESEDEVPILNRK